jgi:hypothetical protein
VCDPTPYANLCQSYCNLCECCVEKQNAGRELDYHGVCKFIDNQTDCNNAECLWRASNEACMIDICLAEMSVDGKVTAPDYSVLKKEYLRTGCPGEGSDLCEKYQNRYEVFIELGNAGRELDYHGVCKLIDNQTDCNNAECLWRASKESCMIDICLAEMSGDGKVTAPDYSVLKKEYLRTGCPCNP